MKKNAGYWICVLSSTIWLGSIGSVGQQGPPPSGPVLPSQRGTIPMAPAGQVSATGLTKFNLDFPGGTPGKLIAAIEKAMGRKLNAIVPEDSADVTLPALKMEQVDVYQLFHALGAASRKQVAVPNARGPAFGSNYQLVETGYSFEPGSRGEGLTDNTIWCFTVMKAVPPPANTPARVCRFYSLAPYLERQLTVDDITTAIETAWKMLGESPTPKISFHKDTKLLIAVGEAGKLETIDAVLQALELPKALKPVPGPSAPPMMPEGPPTRGS